MTERDAFDEFEHLLLHLRERETAAPTVQHALGVLAQVSSLTDWHGTMSLALSSQNARRVVSVMRAASYVESLLRIYPYETDPSFIEYQGARRVSLTGLGSLARAAGTVRLVNDRQCEVLIQIANRRNAIVHETVKVSAKEAVALVSGLYACNVSLTSSWHPYLAEAAIQRLDESNLLAAHRENLQRAVDAERARVELERVERHENYRDAVVARTRLKKILLSEIFEPGGTQKRAVGALFSETVRIGSLAIALLAGGLVGLIVGSLAVLSL